MRAATFLLSSCLVMASAVAQDARPQPAESTSGAAASLPNQEQKADKHNQRIEHIEVEDAGSRVQELRVGGETKQITVQPKVGNLPAYEVQPQNTEGGDGTNGRRVWKALQF